MVFLNLHLETNLQKHEHFWDISASTVKHFLFPVVPLPEKKDQNGTGQSNGENETEKVFEI